MPGSPAHDLLESLPKETVIRIDGAVIPREQGQVNPNMATGAIEIRVSDAEVLGPTAPLTTILQRDCPSAQRCGDVSC